MATNLKQVSVYLEAGVHAWVVKGAREEGRTLSQFVAWQLAALARKPAVLPKGMVMWPTAAAPAMPPQAVAPKAEEEGIVIGENGLPPISIEQLRAMMAPERPALDPLKYGPLTAGEYEIPSDWHNEYGKTLAEQNEEYEDEELEYWAPGYAPGESPVIP
jgi:hypothetical protein